MGGRSESGFEVRSGAGEDGAAAGFFSGLVTTGASLSANSVALIRSHAF